MAGRGSKAREWLDSRLFRDHEPAARPTPRSLLAGLGLALAGILLILLRLGWSGPLDAVWVEDGGIFLNDALHRGFLDALTTTYADYLHVVPRLLAELVALAPLEWAPELFSLFGGAVVVLCAFVVWWASAGHFTDRRLRALLAALVVLVPVAGYESLANLAYLSWFLLFASFWVLLWRPASLAAAIAGGVFLALTLMTAPQGLFLLPLVVARAFAWRDRRDGALIAGYAIGAAVQTVAVLTDDSPSPVTPDWDWALIPVYLLRIVGGALFGQYGDAGIWIVVGKPYFALLVIAFAALVAIAVVRRSAPNRALAAFAIALSVTLFLFTGYQRDLAETMNWPADDASTTGARHTIVPVLLLISVLLLQLQARPPSLSELNWRRLRLAGLAAVVLVALSAFYVANDYRFNPTWSAELTQASAECASDAGMSVPVPVAPGEPWIAWLPCERLE
jgi:hypothetical protein